MKKKWIRNFAWVGTLILAALACQAVTPSISAPTLPAQPSLPSATVVAVLPPTQPPAVLPPTSAPPATQPPAPAPTQAYQPLTRPPEQNIKQDLYYGGFGGMGEGPCAQETFPADFPVPSAMTVMTGADDIHFDAVLPLCLYGFLPDPPVMLVIYTPDGQILDSATLTAGEVVEGMLDRSLYINDQWVGAAYEPSTLPGVPAMQINLMNLGLWWAMGHGGQGWQVEVYADDRVQRFPFELPRMPWVEVIPPQPPNPFLRPEAPVFKAGQQITVQGGGFAPGQTLALGLFVDNGTDFSYHPVDQGVLQADAQGNFRTLWDLPAGLTPGTYRLGAFTDPSNPSLWPVGNANPSSGLQIVAP